MIDWSAMRVFDMHSHWGTQRGYRLRTEAERAQQPNTWKSTAKYVSEQEMADYFRKHKAKVILDLGCTVGHSTLAWKERYPDAEVHGIDVGAPCVRADLPAGREGRRCAGGAAENGRREIFSGSA